MYIIVMLYYKGKVGEICWKSVFICYEFLMIIFDDFGQFDYDGGGYWREFYFIFFQKVIRDWGLFVGNYL